MKKVLFMMLFALVAICMMVGCSGETKVVDSAANLEILNNAVSAVGTIRPIKEENLNKDIVMTTDSDYFQYDEYVREYNCDKYEVTKAEGKCKVTTNSDLTSTSTDVTLEVTEDIKVELSATDFDGNPKTLTFKMDKGTTIESEWKECEKYTYYGSDDEIKVIIKGKINDVDTNIKYNVKHLYNEESYVGSAIVNDSELKQSLLTKNTLGYLMENYIEVKQSPI